MYLAKYSPRIGTVKRVTGCENAVLWLRLLADDFSVKRSVFASRSRYMGFVVYKVALGKVFLRVLQFSPAIIIPPQPHTHISSSR
jgi:hypothetical protein